MELVELEQENVEIQSPSPSVGSEENLTSLSKEVSEEPNPSDLNLNEETVDRQTFVCKEQPTEAFSRIHQMRDDGKLCDVTLIVADREIHAHRVVLAASSDYFYSMFVRDMLESRQERIELKGVDPDAMQMLVEFAYSTKLDITTNNVQSLMTAASVFNFPSVFKATAKFLSNQLHPSNCLGIRSFAKTHGSEPLIEAATAYFRDHFMDAVKNEEYLSLPAEDLAHLLDLSLIHI